jgi:hypothetical protein
MAFLFLIYAMIVVTFLCNQPLSDGKVPVLVDVTFYRFFHGVDFVDLSYFYKEGRFSISFYWVFFQITPLLLVGNFAFSDIQQNGVYLFSRVTKKHFLWLTKILSLFFISLVFGLLCIFFGLVLTICFL